MAYNNRMLTLGWQRCGSDWLYPTLQLCQLFRGAPDASSDELPFLQNLHALRYRYRLGHLQGFRLMFYRPLCYGLAPSWMLS
jgi:hypothetical protein